ncbi:adaptin N terminal region-domain-containing protein [Dioszegia hungarica]|uniref:Adaptin N terminal region-domain-containing protein n=1 Tax=Dioszegia hungarica TaxID=4972 RepID=A0AA38H1I0_9TREE|nr:adaptin N terminal region-domain-containing protein [Dioszegia hungarica]KAI9632628.1 adaptin N terminal region-domain-containing protein [Dioszegia hungarica]
MAALNRLSQRIKENFQESTRDFAIPGGSASTATYFDTSDDKIKEISKLLESRHDKERLEGMKRIIAGISKGRDMEPFFAQVVKNVVAPSIEIRKLVYIYLLRFASTNSDLLLLSINTFQKDLSDQSPLIRSMSLRVLTSIRVPVIQGIVMLGLKKLVNDRNPWVRKTVAGGLAKVYEVDNSQLSSLIPLLQTLLSSQSPLTLGATLTAFVEICPDRLDLLHPYYRHICRLLVDADEWGQAVAVEVLTRYCRAMLEKPEPLTTNADSDDELEGVDIDLAMFLDCAKPLFQSRNPAVVLAMAKAYYHLAPAGHKLVGQEQLVAPVLRLANGKAEVMGLAWEVIAVMSEERPWLFRPRFTSTFLHAADSTYVNLVKLRAMSALHYIRFPDTAVAEEAVRAIGALVRSQPVVASTGLATLMRWLRSNRGEVQPGLADIDNLVGQSVISLKSIILTLPASATPSPRALVARLAKQLPTVTNHNARASVFWLVGQYASSDSPNEHGLGWEGVQAWVPDVLRQAVKGFAEESSIAKLQILTLSTKVAALAPASSQLTLLTQYLFNLARYDASYDVRDRGRLLSSLLRGVVSEADTEEDQGGVVLRREQVKAVLLGQRPVAEKQSVDAELEAGSMSRVLRRRMVGYEGLPEWTNDPTDSNLRDSEVEHQKPPAPTSMGSHIPPPAIPVHLSSSVTSIARSPSTSNASPVGSAPIVKSKFQDLDAFLDSETEDETESEEE